MRIDNIAFEEKPVFLAPMDDVTDPAFRKICKQFGADMVYTEFVSSEALIRNVNKSLQKMTINEAERPVAIQIYGYQPDSMAEAAKIAETFKPDIIDLNHGCPVKKVANKGAGAALLKNIPLMLKITKSVVEAVKTPVTVKTRLGWDNSSKIIYELSEQLQDCGIKALTIHGRTRSEMYKGEADWELIGKIKNNPKIKIPIIGNGDIDNPLKAKEYFNKYGVDAIMVGRAAIGQPWIFSEIKEYIKNGNIETQLNFEDKKKILKEHIIASIYWLDINKDKDNINDFMSVRLKGIIHSRRHLAASSLFKGIPNFRETRIKMLRSETLSELFEILDNI